MGGRGQHLGGLCLGGRVRDKGLSPQPNSPSLSFPVTLWDLTMRSCVEEGCFSNFCGGDVGVRCVLWKVGVGGDVNMQGGGGSLRLVCSAHSSSIA